MITPAPPAGKAKPSCGPTRIRTLPAGRALVLWSRLPPVLVRMPLLSERADWPEVRAEELAARHANDKARALAVPGTDPSLGTLLESSRQ